LSVNVASEAFLALFWIVALASTRLSNGVDTVLKLPALERLGRELAPMVMIGISLYILGDTATDME
jgi:hypothetical protein